jgi:hypothetical protein
MNARRDRAQSVPRSVRQPAFPVRMVSRFRLRGRGVQAGRGPLEHTFFGQELSPI